MPNEKSKIATRIKTERGYKRTRQTIAEFQRSAKAAKLLLDAVRTAGVKARDKALFSRLLGLMFKIIKSDDSHRRGDRTVIDGDIELMRGFDFNQNGKLSSLLFIQPTASIDRVTGAMKVDLPVFVPEDMVKAPLNATHFKVACAAAEVDFAEGTFVTATARTEALPFNDEELALPISLTATVTPNSTKWLILAVGIAFNDVTADKADSFAESQYNGMCIVAVSSPNA